MTTTNNEYALVAATSRARDYVLLDTFASYGDAVTAFVSADEHRDEFPEVAFYAVRSTDDPRVKTRPLYIPELGRLYYGGRTRAAVREARRKEIGATALWAIKKAKPGDSFDRVVATARASLKERNIEVERWQIEDAVKRRVIIGRCHGHGHRKVAFWVPKREGPLSKLSCPDCGRWLNQTSLALDAPIRRLDPEAAREEGV
jgi:hypothetical protein